VAYTASACADQRYMSAIDFNMSIEREPDAKGDRVKIGMSGKFLPFKRF
jgi:cyanate lyase